MSRLVIGSLLFLFGVGTVIYAPLEPKHLTAQAKDSKQVDQLQKQLKDARRDLSKAEAQVKSLQQELRERDLKINQLQASLKKEKHDSDAKDIRALKQDLAEAQQKLKEKDTLIATLRKSGGKGTTELTKQMSSLQSQVAKLEQMKNANYVHVVLYKFKSDAPASESRVVLEDVTRLLARIPSVRGIWAGKPAFEATPDVAIKDYDVALLVLFENVDGLKLYLDDPLYKKFLTAHEKYFDKPRVYDYERK